MKSLLLTVLMFPVLTLGLSGCGGSSKAEKHYNAGTELQEHGRFGEAIAEYDEAIRLNPQLGPAYYSRAIAYTDLDQHQRAIEDYDVVID